MDSGNILLVVLFFLMFLILVSPVIYLRHRKRKKFFEKISGMSASEKQIEIAKLASKKSDFKTSHLLHLFITVFTMGLWVIPWIIVSSSNSSQRKEIDKLMDGI